MLAIPLGIFTIILGSKAFSKEGIPLSKKKNLTGTGAMVIGVICIILGLLFLLSGIMTLMR